MTDHIFKTSETKPAKSPNSLLHSDTLSKVLGADAMQILRCGICMDFFEVPIVLPCGHTFCLHCLTQMCKHASLNHAPNSAQDVRIGCPNCRVLIYATPILRRNVTCNFIIQSLIECLRVREDRQPLTHSQGVNTDDELPSTLTQTTIQSPGDHDDAEMMRLLNDFDRMTKTLSRANIVDRAFLEIEEIRNNHLARERQRQADRDARTRDQVRFVQNIIKQSRDQQNIQQQNSHQQHRQQQQQQQQRQILPRPQQTQNQKRPESQSETNLLFGKSPHPSSFQSESYQSQPKQAGDQQNNIQHHQHQQSTNCPQQSFQHNRQGQHQHLNNLLQQQQQQQQTQEKLCDGPLMKHPGAINTLQLLTRLDSPSTSVKTTNIAARILPRETLPTSNMAVGTLPLEILQPPNMATRQPPVDTLPISTKTPEGVQNSSGQTEHQTTSNPRVHLNNDPAVMSFSLATNTSTDDQLGKPS